MFKSIFSLSPLLHFLPLSFFVANPALRFPGSARLSISSSSLHLSAAAEPGPHHPACQSPLYTFNPSYPSLCKADSHTVPPPVPPSPSPHHHHLHLLLSKQLPPQKNWDPFNSPTSTFTHKHLPSLERGKHTKRYIVCVCACVHTSMNTCTNRGKGQHWTNKWFMLCNYTQRTQCTPMTL